MAFLRDPDLLHRGVGAIAASDGVAGTRRMARRAAVARATALRDRARAKSTLGPRGGMAGTIVRMPAKIFGTPLPSHATSPGTGGPIYAPLPVSPTSIVGVRRMGGSAPYGTTGVSAGGGMVGGGSPGFHAGTFPQPGSSTTGGGGGGGVVSGGGGVTGVVSSGGSISDPGTIAPDGGGAGTTTGVPMTPIDLGPPLPDVPDVPPPSAAPTSLVDQITQQLAQIPTWAKVGGAALAIYLLTRPKNKGAP